MVYLRLLKIFFCFLQYHPLHNLFQNRFRDKMT
jgi:hypothetical protein